MPPRILDWLSELTRRHVMLAGRAGEASRPEHAEFRARIAPAVEDLRLAAANIAAPDGTLIASLVPKHVGARLSPGSFARLKHALDGGSVFIGPTREEERLPGMTESTRRDVSIVWTAAAIRNRDGRDGSPGAHRDVKPENVIIQADADGRPRAKLIDFGFAKSRAEQERMAATQDMSLMGTIGYLAPERIRNPADDDIRGDVYSVGALGYFVLTRKELLPDIGNLEDTKRQFAPPPGFIDDEAVAGIIMQAMAVSKTRRWASCAALDDALRRLAEARAASSRPALPP